MIIVATVPLMATVMLKINYFYGCDFMAPVERIMEQHYQQKHALKPKEVKRG